MRKQLFWLFVIFFLSTCNGQNKKIMYDFGDLNQSTLVNPSFFGSSKLSIGFPLLSEVGLQFGTKNFTIFDLFSRDTISFNEKVERVIGNLTPRDFFTLNAQVETLNIGIRLNERTYLSFGHYAELDAIVFFPRDLVELAINGNNPFINRGFKISEINYKADLVGVYHVGMAFQKNERLKLGFRTKIYSSAINLESKNNQGSFTTVRGNTNRYIHYFNNVNMTFKSSGLIRSDTLMTNNDEHLKNLFRLKSIGVGVDFGFSLGLSKQLKISGSILDFGFIKHSNDVQTRSYDGSFTYEGIGYQISNNQVITWSDVQDIFNATFPKDWDTDSYISWRPLKFNAAMKYSFGERRSKVCYDNSYEDFYTDAVGVHLFSVFRPLFPQVALTGFYQKSLSDKIHAKVTYTVDDYSFHNLGFGFSMQLSKLNLYTTFDNILNYGNITKTNNVSFQFGANIIFN